MTTIIIEKNIIVKDADGNIYSIPPHLKPIFEELKESIVDSVFGSNDWWDANDTMHREFNQYRK